MPNPIKYLWDAGVRLFRSLRDRIIPPKVVRQGIDAFTAHAAADLDDAAKRFESGAITADAFRDAARVILKSIHLASGTIASGGRRNLDPKAIEIVEIRLRDEFAFLDRMIAEVKSGKQPMDGTFRARVAQYAAAGTPTYELVRRQHEIDAGDMDEEKRELHSVVPCP